jgi:hypothetical protein
MNAHGTAIPVLLILVDRLCFDRYKIDYIVLIQPRFSVFLDESHWNHVGFRLARSACPFVSIRAELMSASALRPVSFTDDHAQTDRRTLADIRGSIRSR